MSNEEYTEEDRQEHIKMFADGDTKRFNDGLLDSHRNRYRFNELALGEQIHPEYEMDGKKIIEYLLGYQPPDTYTIKQEPFLRLLHADQTMGKTTLEQMFLEAEEHIKLIREFDMLQDRCWGYSRNTYHAYFQYLPELAEAAKQRVANFLGYEPWLEASVDAEMLLREAMADEKFRFTDNINTVDMQVITRIHYREVFLQKGVEAANASPLIACDYRFRFPFNPENEKI